jgi:DNA polymerase III subunit delta
MNILGLDALRGHIKNNTIGPLYLLFGAETYLRDNAVKALADRVLAGSALREFNDSTYSLNEVPLPHALASAEQLPMMAERRIIRITELNKLKEEDEGPLSRYLARPAESSVVIFITEILDKRLRISRMLLESCAAVEFRNQNDSELLEWITRRAKELSVSFDMRAARYLVAQVGSNLRRLNNEIEKLATAALPDAVITYELVEAVVPNSRELSNFALTDHLLSRNRAAALHVMQKILDDGAEPLMILGLIASNYRRLFLARELMNSGQSSQEVARSVRLPPDKQSDFLAAARRTDTKHLTHIMKRLSEADVAIKTSRATPRLVIEMLICELVAA